MFSSRVTLDEPVDCSILGDLALGVSSQLIAKDASVGDLSCLSDAFGYSSGSQQPSHFWRLMVYRSLAKKICDEKAAGLNAIASGDTLRDAFRRGGDACE